MTFETLQAAYNQIMSEYMHTDETHDDPDPWSNTPFTQIDKLKDYGDTRNALVREGAEKIHRALRDGPIESDESVKEAMKPLTPPETRLTAYYLNAGPVAATAEGVRWNTAFQIDLTEAPEFGTDAYFSAAEQLSIPDTRQTEMIPEKVEECYKALYERTERNGGDRAVHPEELRGVGPRLPDRSADRAFRYLAELPGVEPPAETGPAWERVETDETASSAETAGVEG